MIAITINFNNDNLKNSIWSGRHQDHSSRLDQLDLGTANSGEEAKLVTCIDETWLCTDKNVSIALHFLWLYCESQESEDLLIRLVSDLRLAVQYTQVAMVI